LSINDVMRQRGGRGVHDIVTMCDIGEEGVKNCVTSCTSRLWQGHFTWFCT